jgi:hypothetical protein
MLLLLFGCSDRPLRGCTTGTDCAFDEWCVQSWWAKEEPALVCAPQCSTDGDCVSGECWQVGDGATTDVTDPRFSACH